MDKRINYLSPLDKDWENSIIFFLYKWFDSSEFVEFRTSGSTGTPKKICARKEYMRVSASNTINFLGLKKGDTALLCLPVDYISGSMMIVRSLVADLNLYTERPTLNPFANTDMSFDFVAMTTPQVIKTLENEREYKLFCNSKNIIIGGSAIDKSLEDRLKDIDTNIYSTYGMTETLSHIALRKIDNSPSSLWYVPFDNVNVSLSDGGTLVIDAPQITDCVIETNDIAEIDSNGKFRILGRKDNVINSGGVKIQVEDVEEKILLKTGINVLLTYVEDNVWGQKVVMLVSVKDRISQDAINLCCVEDLSKYEKPKHIIYVEELPMTRTGKYDRYRARQIAEKEFYNDKNVN